MARYEDASTQAYTSLAVLNAGQAVIFTFGLAAAMVMCAYEVQRRHQDGRRFRADQRHDDPALPAAQFHGHGLSRDQAGGDRYRADVLDPGARAGDQGHRRRAAAAGDQRHHPFRKRALRLRAGAPHSERHQLRRAGRQDGGGGRPFRRRQVDDLAAAVSLLRSRRRPHPDRRPGHRQGHASLAAPGHRHGAAGHRAVQRHHPLQHPLWPLGGERCRGGGRRPGSRRSTR